MARRRVPSPGQVEEAVQRMFSFSEITFEVDIHGWRTVYLSGMRPVKTPSVSRAMLSFECHPFNRPGIKSNICRDSTILKSTSTGIPLSVRPGP